MTKKFQESQVPSYLLRDKFYPTLNSFTGTYTDLKFRWRGPQAPPEKVVIVAVDDYSLENLGRWPWSRDVMGLLTERLFESGVKAVGFDIVFSEEEKVVSLELKDALEKRNLSNLLKEFDNDAKFSETIKTHKNKIVLGWAAESACRPYDEPISVCNVTDTNDVEAVLKALSPFRIKDIERPSNFDVQKTPVVSTASVISNIPKLSDSALYAGPFNAIPDSDGYVRRSSLLYLAGGEALASLPLLMASVGQGDPLKLVFDNNSRVERLEFKTSQIRIPVNSRGDINMNFYGPAFSFPYVSALDVINTEDVLKVGRLRDRDVPRSELLKDAYVLIGTSAMAVYDMRAFPFDPNTPGVEGHATVLANILTRDYLRSESQSVTTALVLTMVLLGLFFVFVFNEISAIPILIVSISASVILFAIDNHVLFVNNVNWNLSFIYLEIFFVTAVTLGAKYISEEREKKFIQAAFGKYVSPTVVASILQDPSKLSLGGAKQELSILFSDIRGFTTFSEKLDAKVLSALLNEYLGSMTQIIVDKYNGTLDKYIGDAIMAFWGAPIFSKNHASKSLQAAIAMQKQLKADQDKLKQKYGVEIEVGMGINSGVVSVGNMGSTKNFSYTAIGDNVNLASRVEGLTKYYGAGILTTNLTMNILKNSGDTSPPHRILDKVKVKGKNEAVDLIQVFSEDVPADFLTKFEQARQFYLNRQWNQAIANFKEATQIYKDKTCEVYIERCQQFAQTPPPPQWDGSFEMTSK